MNSVVISLATVAICLHLRIVAAYALSRFVGRRTRRWVLLALLRQPNDPAAIWVIVPFYFDASSGFASSIA